MSEEFTFIWEIEVMSNKNRMIKIIISQIAVNVEIARNTLIYDIIKLSRYGIPCYIIDELNNKCILSYFNKDINYYCEYYEITNNFMNMILYKNPEIQHLKPINICKKLNPNAKPFVPNNYLTFYNIYQ